MIVVVWKKSDRAKTYHMTVFTNIDSPDSVNNTRVRKPIIPIEYPYIELGVGESFIKTWKEKYNIKKIQYWPKK